MSLFYIVCPDFIACESQIPLLEYLLHSFILSMNIPLLTTPSFRSPHVVVVWECKNSFFCIPRNTLAHFFLFFLHFFVILLCINKIKMHFSSFFGVFWP